MPPDDGDGLLPVDEAVRRVQAGDTEAYTAIVRACQRPLRSWLSRWCIPGIDADEVAQTAFITAYRRIGDFAAGTNFFAWLCAIARNVARDELKRQRREADRSRAASVEWQAAWEDLDRGGDDAGRIQALRDCLARLSGASAELVRRYYGEQLGIEQCAQLFGKTATAIKSQLHWLRGKLRACMVARMEGAA